MIHERHFSVEEANAALEWLRPRIESLREARDRLADPAPHSVLSEAAPQNGGGEPGKKVGQAFLEVRDQLAELAEAGIVLRDLDRGLVDFPAILEGREVYLCWELGEDGVGFWHELDAGFGGRRSLT